MRAHASDFFFKMATEQEENFAGTDKLNIGGKSINDMKVEELKAELELRGLKKSGVKKELQERLIEVEYLQYQPSHI